MSIGVSGSSESGPKRDLTVQPREKKGILAGAIAGANISVVFAPKSISLISKASKDAAISGSKAKAHHRGIASRKAHGTSKPKKTRGKATRSTRSKRGRAAQDIEEAEEAAEAHEPEEKNLVPVSETGESSHQEQDQQEKREQLFSRLRQLAEQGETKDLQNIIDTAWGKNGVYDDVTEAYDGLRAAQEHFGKSEEEQLKNLSVSTLAAGDILYKENGPDIRAGYLFGPGTSETLSYREYVLRFEKVSETFQALMEKTEGDSKHFTKEIDKLIKGIQIDIKAQESTLDPSHLRQIMQGLFTVQICSQLEKECNLLLRDMHEFYGIDTFTKKKKKRTSLASTSITKLLFVGDVMLGRLVNDCLSEKSFTYPWGDTLDVFRSADVRFCNLECVISDKGEPWSQPPKTFHFRSDSKNISVLKNAKIDCVSLANNHVLDYGYDALLEMFDILKKEKIHFAGAGVNIEAARKATVFKIDECRIGFLALTDNEAEWLATNERPGTYYMPISVKGNDPSQLMDLIKKTKADVDILIVSAHWGSNWGYRPEHGHVDFAHLLVDSGADIVFGHSCHVVRGVEIYQNRPIIYGAGDFIDDYAVDPDERNDESFIFLVETEGTQITGLKLYPTVIRNCQARHAKGELGERIGRKMMELCEELNTIVRWNGDLQCLEIFLND